MFKFDKCRHNWAAVSIKELLLLPPLLSYVAALNFHWKLPYAFNYCRLSASAWTKTEYAPDKPGCCCQTTTRDIRLATWCHQMETFSTLLALCAGNSPVNVEFPSQRPVTRSFDVFFDLRLNKWLSKQSRRWWFEEAIALIMTSL